MMIAMNDNPLKFSLIIPAWPKEGRPFGLDFIDQLDWPQENLEVIIARGYSPCKQRNHAARQATGDILIFFDKIPFYRNSPGKIVRFDLFLPYNDIEE